MIQILFERSYFELVQIALGSIEQVARCRDLFQEQWIGSIENDEIHESLAVERL